MIRTERHDHVLVVTIDRPEARNAVNGAVAEGIEAAIDELEADDDLWVGVLTGAGPVFCAGADLKEIAAGNANTLGTKRGGFGGLVWRERAKPIIAAVNGPALAGGTELVLACDMVLAAESASFGLPEAKRSLVAAAGGLFRLPRALGSAVAMEAIATGDPIPVARAHQLGMVNHVVADGEVLDAALALAERVCAAAPLAVRESRAVARRAFETDERVLFDASAEAFARIAETEDYREGPRAFIEKRDPVWQGR
ncbi:MAG: crotonase/enoyl-CoA hydratase family protein [Acidimicrobiia bacterium]